MQNQQRLTAEVSGFAAKSQVRIVSQIRKVNNVFSAFSAPSAVKSLLFAGDSIDNYSQCF